ncbi:MAG: mechanosensitive ion channel domain-containing protein [Pseudoalteromonas distincta]
MTNPTFLRAIPALLLFFLMTVMSSASVFAQDASQQTPPDASQESAGSSYASLADILENEEARERLVRELRELSGQERAEQAELAEPPLLPGAEPPEEVSFARRIAHTTQDIAQNFVGELSAGMQALRTVGSGDEALDMAVLTAAAINLGLVILATLVLFFILRGLVRPLFAKANTWALRDTGHSPLLRRFVAVAGSALLDFAVIVLAYLGGYLLAIFVIGVPGELDARETLFLNAFLVVEVFKAILRMLFAHKDDGLRMLPLTAEQAAYWNAWLARLSSFIGYGILLIVPMINFNVSPAVGRLAALIIMLLAFLNALMIILQNKTLVAARLEERAHNSNMGFVRVMLGMLAKCWHVLAILYFAALVVVTVARPDDALPFMLGASLQTLLAIGVGLFVSVVLTQLISRGFRVSEETRLRFPMLEARLNSFIPTALKVARVIILVVVLGFIADAWTPFSLVEWIGSEAGTRVVGAMVSVAIIITLAMVFWIGAASWIEQRLNPNTGVGEPSAREKTLLTIFRNALAITLIVMTLMIVLAEIGINIGPLIAGAGVLGLAIGFGAQKLVQDIITGVFIQLENAINTGEVVTAGGITGTAETLTIRSLGIRDLSGTYHLIPFSSVDTVSNYMRGFGYHVGEYGVAYREDIDQVIVHLREAFAELISDPEHQAKVLDDLEVHGVTALADSSVNIRVRIKTLPGAQWATGRAYNRLVKYHLDAAGIEIPFPHLTMYFGQDKDGTAPPAPLLVQRPERDKKEGKVERVTDEQSATNAKEGEDYDEAN